MKRRGKRHPNTSKIDYYNYGDEVRKLRGVGISFQHIGYLLSHRCGRNQPRIEWKSVYRWCKSNLI